MFNEDHADIDSYLMYVYDQLILHRAKYEYYVLGGTNWSDNVFDTWFKWIEKREQKHPEWVTNASVTQTVGYNSEAHKKAIELYRITADSKLLKEKS